MSTYKSATFGHGRMAPARRGAKNIGETQREDPGLLPHEKMGPINNMDISHWGKERNIKTTAGDYEGRKYSHFYKSGFNPNPSIKVSDLKEKLTHPMREGRF